MFLGYVLECWPTPAIEKTVLRRDSNANKEGPPLSSTNIEDDQTATPQQVSSYKAKGEICFFSLRHFGHFSRSCIKTRRNSVH